jgi:putative endonuclease
MSSPWFVYMVLCADGSYYTGITNQSPAQRVWEHNHSPRGAKYTRSRRPVRSVYCLRVPTRSAAAKREAALKKLSHEEKKKWDHSRA